MIVSDNETVDETVNTKNHNDDTQIITNATATTDTVDNPTKAANNTSTDIEVENHPKVETKKRYSFRSHFNFIRELYLKILIGIV